MFLKCSEKKEKSEDIDPKNNLGSLRNLLWIRADRYIQGESLFGDERWRPLTTLDRWPFYRGNLSGKLQGPVQQWPLWAGDRSMEVTVNAGFTVYGHDILASSRVLLFILTCI